MGKVKNAIMTVEDLFTEAKSDYEFWRDEIEKHGFTEDNAIAAAQKYGMMCAYATVNEELLGDLGLREVLNHMYDYGKTKLYRTEFEDEES